MALLPLPPLVRGDAGVLFEHADEVAVGGEAEVGGDGCLVFDGNTCKKSDGGRDLRPKGVLFIVKMRVKGSKP